MLTTQFHIPWRTTPFSVLVKACYGYALISCQSAWYCRVSRGSVTDRRGSMTREIPRTEMAESAVLKRTLSATDSRRRYDESTFWWLRIRRFQSYAGNLLRTSLTQRANRMGLTLSNTQRHCLFNKDNHIKPLNIFGLILGFVMLFSPVLSIVTLRAICYMVAIYLILFGIESLIAAFARRNSDW